MRILEEGWVCAALEDPAGRRGIWFRYSASADRLEVCGGREGDDFYVDLRVDGNSLDHRQLNELVGLLDTARWSREARIDAGGE